MPPTGRAVAPGHLTAPAGTAIIGGLAAFCIGGGAAEHQHGNANSCGFHDWPELVEPRRRTQFCQLSSRARCASDGFGTFAIDQWFLPKATEKHDGTIIASETDHRQG